MGESGSAKVGEGHLTNFAKLYRNAALIWYSVAGWFWAKPFKFKVKIRAIIKNTTLMIEGPVPEMIFSRRRQHGLSIRRKGSKPHSKGNG
jgi:hypothetical protein